MIPNQRGCLKLTSSLASRPIIPSSDINQGFKCPPSTSFHEYRRWSQGHDAVGWGAGHMEVGLSVMNDVGGKEKRIYIIEESPSMQ